MLRPSAMDDPRDDRENAVRIKRTAGINGNHRYVTEDGRFSIMAAYAMTSRGTFATRPYGWSVYDHHSDAEGAIRPYRFTRLEKAKAWVLGQYEGHPVVEREEAPVAIVRGIGGHGYRTTDGRYQITPRYDLSIRGGTQTRHCGWKVMDTVTGRYWITTYTYLADAKESVLNTYR